MNDCVVRLALVMPSSTGSACGRLALPLDDPLVVVAEGEAVHRLALEEVGVARLGHAHLLQHLAHDHADVLVADAHALQPVDLLHLVEQVLLHRARPLDEQDVVRVHRALGEAVARPHPVALVHPEVLARRHLVQLRLGLLRPRLAGVSG